MNLSHRIALDPTARQLAYFRQAAGTRRFVWNWALAEWERQYSAGGKPIGPDLQKAFNAIKYSRFPWLAKIHRDAHARPFIELQQAYRNFFAKRARRPSFKRRHGGRDAFYVANDRFRLDGLRVRLPIIGWVRMREKLRFSGKILAATVSRTADRWYISIAVQTNDPRPNEVPPAARREAVGVDLGLKHAAITSVGVVFDAPKPLKRALGSLRCVRRPQSRRLIAGRVASPDDRRYRSNNYRRGQLRLARLHAHVANIRNDFIHKMVTTICRENQAVGVEDLHVKGMLKNRSLARALSDVSLGEILRQFSYKADIYGTRLVVADRFYPSSKTCSSCGTIKGKLSLAEREFVCEACGLVIDRDLNAAINLEKLTKKEYPGRQGNRRLWTGRRGATSQDGEQPSLEEAGTRPCPLAGTT